MSSPITGFTAIPNPQMLAFMPIQSYLMMYFAGAGWQIGKRKISAIPNDKFNAMSANDLLKGFTADLRETIPTLERSMLDVTPLIKILIEQYGDFVKEAIAALPAAAQTVAGALVNPKGALVPPLYGAELEKLVSGGGTEAQFLAYAKILMQQEIDKLNKSKIDIKVDVAKTTSKTFQGPEINPATGEQSTFLKSMLNLPTAQKHIKSSGASNVSLQSLQLNQKILQQNIRSASIKLKNAQASFNITKLWSPAGKKTKAHVIMQRQRAVGIANQQLIFATQKMADFLKMHGHRL